MPTAMLPAQSAAINQSNLPIESSAAAAPFMDMSVIMIWQCMQICHTMQAQYAVYKGKI